MSNNGCGNCCETNTGDYKKVDRSDPRGLFYVFIRAVCLLPIPIVREILLIPIFRHIFFGVIKLLSKHQEKTRKEFPDQMQTDKHYLFSAIIDMTIKTIFDAPNMHVRRKRLHMFLNIFMKRIPIIEKYRKEHDDYPPGFLTIAIGKFCNLKCKGCYASSESSSSEKLTFDTMDRIVREKKELWGSFFTVITGGEPLAWRSDNKTLFDLAKKHNDQLFMFYTNGTLLDDEAVKKMNELGNMSPAISVEGFEKETDFRRGEGTYKKIMEAMKRLREAKVGFGISLTATKENAEMLCDEKIFDFYFKECGASYAWIFQYMPVGRGITLDLLVTPEQRIKLLRNIQNLVKDKHYFIADFWNSGTCVEGCISAGRQGGFFYIDWSGNVAPCAFNPYSPVNILDIYRQGKNLNALLDVPFFKAIRDWQNGYGLKREKGKIGNWIIPCPSKDHYKQMRELIDKYKPMPLDESAREALEDDDYKKGLIQYGEDVAKAIDPIWEKEYLNKK